MAEISNILFPTDYSELSNRAFPYAAALARAYGARITLLHVSELEEQDPNNPEHSFPALDAFGGEVERVVVRGHSPYKDILEVTRQKNCDLVVMATHGRSELGQFFAGRSVSEDVSELSNVPVLIVPTRKLEGDAVSGQFREILVAGGGGAARAHAEALAQKLGARVTEAGGDDAGEVVRAAGELGADLIVINTKRDDGLSEEVAGKFADRVIQQSHCPVLTVRA
jgi:nucleotide-binding universal stress UspA family protein